MKRVGITGQSGFMGSHLFNYLDFKEEIHRVLFKDSFFEKENLLEKFVFV